MSNKGLVIGLCFLGAIIIFIVLRTIFPTGDTTVEERRQDMNVEMERTMRATGRRQSIQEELSEEQAMEERAAQQQGAQ